MKKNIKKYVALLLSAMLIAALAVACTAQDDPKMDPTTNPTVEPSGDPVVIDPIDPTDAPPVDPTDEPDPSDDPGTQVPNPRTEYASVAELNAALGFDVRVLSEETGFTAASFASIGLDATSMTGEIVYRNEAGAEICLRTAKGTEDISGMAGATYADKTYGEQLVHNGSLDEVLVAWFTDGTMVYSISAEELSAEAFDNLLTALTTAA